MEKENILLACSFMFYVLSVCYTVAYEFVELNGAILGFYLISSTVLYGFTHSKVEAAAALLIGSLHSFVRAIQYKRLTSIRESE